MLLPGHSSLPLWKMDDEHVWEPSTEKETAYYDTLFRVVDRDKSGTVDGKEAVHFLAHSGLSKTQLKDIWSVASSPGQTSLQRPGFCVAMRAVALAQNGEASLTRAKIRDTASESIAMATFKGMPAPPIKCSKGKKPKNKASTKTASKKKTGAPKVADVAPASSKIVSTKKTATKSDAGTSAKKSKPGSAASEKTNEGGKKAAGVSTSKAQSDGAAADTTQKAKGTPKKPCSSSSRDSDDGGSSSSSGSNSDGGASSRSGGEDTGSDSDHSEGGASKENSKTRVNTESDLGKKRRRQSSHHSSDSEGSTDGESQQNKNSSRGGGHGDDEDDGEASDSDKSSGSGSGSDSSADSSNGVGDEGNASDDGGTLASEAGIDETRSRSSSTSSSSSSSSSSEEEEEGPDPFVMSEKARVRYQAIFSKIDAAGTGSLSGKQVIGLFAKSGLDKEVLATIWRLSDLDEDGGLSAKEFEIAFHLIFCATQRKLEVPDELPPSLWPAGYIPPSVLARRKEEAKRKRQEEERERRRKEKAVVGGSKSGKTNTDTAAALDAAKTTKKQKKKPVAAKANKKGKKAAGDSSSDKKNQGEEDEKERNEEAARAAASLQKREELAKKRAAKSAKNKNKKTRTGNKLLGAAAAEAKAQAEAKAPVPAPAPAPSASTSLTQEKEGEASSTATASKANAESEAVKQPPEKEGSLNSDVPPAAATPAAASARSDASGAPSPVAGGNEPGIRAKKKNKRQRPPVSDVPSSVADGSDVDCGGGTTRAPEVAAAVGPLTMAERRAKKAEARAAKAEAARLKKESAARDATLAGLDLQDDVKTFTIKAMAPMEQGSGSIHMLSDLGQRGDNVGTLSFAQLSAPLPYLTPHPGRPPCLQLQEFSVSFPSGIRRASALTPSLDIRLGPPPAPSQPTPDSNGLIRCPECAEFLPSAQIVRHIRSTCRLLPCPLCSALLLPADLERHLEEACPSRRRGCARCGEAVILGEFARHEKEGGCVRRVVPCAACGEYCFADELMGHEAKECPEREVRCPSCGDALPARNLAEHAPSLCRSTAWTCGCGEGPLPLVDRPSHLKTCDAFIDAWEASIEKVIARMPKIEVVRKIGKVMILTRVENPGIALLALAESKGNAYLAARKVNDSRSYIDEICLAADIVNVEVFLKVLKKPEKRGSGALWRAGL